MHNSVTPHSRCKFVVFVIVKSVLYTQKGPCFFISVLLGDSETSGVAKYVSLTVRRFEFFKSIQLTSVNIIIYLGLSVLVSLKKRIL